MNSFRAIFQGYYLIFSNIYFKDHFSLIPECRCQGGFPIQPFRLRELNDSQGIVCFFFLQILSYKTANLKVAVTRHKNSKMPGNKIIHIKENLRKKIK